MPYPLPRPLAQRCVYTPNKGLNYRKDGPGECVQPLLPTWISQVPPSLPLRCGGRATLEPLQGGRFCRGIAGGDSNGPFGLPSKTAHLFKRTSDSLFLWPAANRKEADLGKREGLLSGGPCNRRSERSAGV